MLKKYIKFLFVPEFGLNKAVEFITSDNSNFFINKFSNFKIRKKNILVHSTSKIGKNLYLPHPYNIIIGEGAVIGNNCSIYHEVTIGQNKGKYPHLKDNVIVYPGAKIVGGITVGDNAIVGANSVVNRDVPDNSIVMGVPAKVVGIRNLEDKYY